MTWHQTDGFPQDDANRLNRTSLVSGNLQWERPEREQVSHHGLRVYGGTSSSSLTM